MVLLALNSKGWCGAINLLDVGIAPCKALGECYWTVKVWRGVGRPGPERTVEVVCKVGSDIRTREP